MHEVPFDEDPTLLKVDNHEDAIKDEFFREDSTSHTTP